ncbi:MAG: peptide chain release factor N(5)-glutamine methyltransferase [Chloroflexi bacterium]|nr:peptide chain release factor N(5)-glutamine methyltransferase [Chloroflexota bacterium]
MAAKSSPLSSTDGRMFQPAGLGDSTVGALLRGAETRMRAAGADAPRLTALVLLESASGLSREHLLANPQAGLTPEVGARFNDCVARRCAREPLAYILGEREFYGRPFAVTPATLIPRPETEGLVELALGYLQQLSRLMDPALALDVGTGSGAIAVTLLAEFPRLVVTATDIESSALDVAQANAKRHGVASRLRLIVCDLASALAGPFNLIVANLPYIPSNELDGLQPDVRNYEPRIALDGGTDGTHEIIRLIQCLPRLLAPAGAAFFEIGEGQGPTLEAAVHSVDGSLIPRISRDATGVERYLVVRRSAV